MSLFDDGIDRRVVSSTVSSTESSIGSSTPGSVSSLLHAAAPNVSAAAAATPAIVRVIRLFD